MISVSNFNIPNYTKLLSKELLVVKDYAAIQEISSGKFYTTNIPYLDTMYKEIGLKSHSFVKSIYQLDKNFAVKTISSRIKDLESSIYFSDDNGFIVCSQVSYNNLVYALSELNKFKTKYFSERDKYYTTSNYIVLNNDKGLGVLISLPNDSLITYEVTYKDGIIYMIEDSSFSLSDDNFKVLFDTIIGLYTSKITDQLYDDEYKNTGLTWSDYDWLVKKLNRYDAFTDEDYEKLSNLSDLKKQITLSPYKVIDVLKLLTDSVVSESVNLSLYDVSKVTSKLIKRQLLSLQL